MRGCVGWRRVVIVLVFGIVWGPSCNCSRQVAQRGGERLHPPAPSASRPCRSDSFFIEVPSWAEPSWRDNSFLQEGAEQNISTRLSRFARTEWFCGQNRAECPHTLKIEMKALLPVRTSTRTARGGDWRNTGHLRFYQVRFFDAGRPRPLAILPDAEGEVVDGLRKVFRETVGTTTPFYVGRSCDSVTLGGAEETMTWHHKRIDLPAIQIPQPAGPSARVDIALIDSGVDLGVASEIGVVGPNHPPPLHHHGTAMALFLHEAAPLARIHDLKVFDADGYGSIEQLALALDCALFDIDNPDCMAHPTNAGGGSNRPLIINLSLGWVPELSDPSVLQAGLARGPIREDAVGEAVRWLLEGARLVETKQRPIFVVAATGNRPERLRPPLQEVREARFFPLRCPESPACPPLPEREPECASSNTPYKGQRWFFPAEWAHRRSCDGQRSKPAIVFGVGAVDDRELPIALAIPNAESPLVAPGQYVYAHHVKANAFPSKSICDDQFDYPTGVRLPMPFTGTSVGAAFVSGTAARAQETVLRKNLPPMDWNALARLLYLSGEDLRPLGPGGLAKDTPGRKTPEGITVRRLSIGRLDKALRSPEVLSCIRNIKRSEAIDKQLENDCQAPLASAGVARKLVPAKPDFVDRTGWTIAECPGMKWSLTADAQDAELCPGETCPYEQVGYRTNFGSLSPQPGDGTCVECSVQSPLKIQLSPNHYAGTQIGEAYLVFSGPSRNGSNPAKAYYLDLFQNPNPKALWSPGAWLNITLQGVESQKEKMDLYWPHTEAMLVVRVKDPLGREAMEYAPVRIKPGGP